MKRIVERNKLVKIISKEYSYYNEEQINELIDDFGAEYFNGRGCSLNFKYIGFGKWEITDAE